MEDVKIMLEAPDVYYAALILSKKEFFNGRGDRSSFFEIVLNSDPTTIADLSRKLQLVTAAKFHDLKIFNDTLCSV